MTSRVFVSYASTHNDHIARVGKLIAALRAAGLRVASDRDVTTPQGPPEGWPNWMINRIEEADWVLMVCDDSYYRRFRGIEEAGRGLGARWEGAIISTAIYNEGTINRKFVPVLFDDESSNTIPEALRSSTRYRLPAELPILLRALSNGSGVAEAEPAAEVTVPFERSPRDRLPAEIPIVPKAIGSGVGTVEAEPSAEKEVVAVPLERSRSWGEIAPYALLSLISFVAGFLLAVLLLRNSRLLVSLGLEGHFYYLVLLPLGLSVAGFLFGVLRSFALYRGTHLVGSLELGGPIVGFALVVLGGFLLPAPSSNFPLTVYVHGPAGQQDLPLRSQGAVLLDLGGDRRSAPIGDKGQAFFPEVPANFRGQKVNVALDVAGYERTDDRQLQLDGTSIYLKVQRKPSHIKGNVLDAMGKPVIGARVSVAGSSATSDEQGQFDIMLSNERVEDRMVLRVAANGYQPWSQEVIPNGGAVTAMLQR